MVGVHGRVKPLYLARKLAGEERRSDLDPTISSRACPTSSIAS
jgi:hypothetical protein